MIEISVKKQRFFVYDGQVIHLRHPLPVNPIVTPKPDYREVARRGRDSEIVTVRIET